MADAHVAWGDVGGSPLANFNYKPGVKEFTNLGLLATRAYLTHDAVNKVTYVTPSQEQGLIETPTLAKLKSIYDQEVTVGNETTKPQYIHLPTMQKQLPGMDDAPTWTLMTDDPQEFIGRSYAGKPEKLSTLEFTCPAAMELQDLFMKHATHGSSWTLIQCYDDANEENIFYIVTPRCRLLGTGTSSAENNSGGELSVKFQPMGGIYRPVYISTPRNPSPASGSGEGE